jgi:hypothetical protein
MIFGIRTWTTGSVCFVIGRQAGEENFAERVRRKLGNSESR